MTINQDGMYSEICYMGFAKQGGSDIQFAGRAIGDLEIDYGEKGVEFEPTWSGGRLTKYKPQEPIVIDFEARCLEISTPTGTTGGGFWDLVHTTTDTTYPVVVDFDRTRIRVRMVILRTNVTGVTSANQAVTVATGSRADRREFADGFITNLKESWSPEEGLKVSATFTTSPFDSASPVATNVRLESTDGVDLVATTAYTSTNKF